MMLFDSVRKKVRVASGLFVFLALGAGVVLPVQAQSVSELQNRINRLENEIQTLNRAVYRGERPPAGSVNLGSNVNADTQIKLQQVESELRQIRGMIEELGFENRRLRQDFEVLKGDLQVRGQDARGQDVGSAGQGLNGAPRGNSYQWSSQNAPPSLPSPATQAAPRANQLGTLTQSPSGAVNPSADVAAATYDNAFALLKNNQYEAAQREFDGFLKAYGSHPLAGNAKYWLGETYYVRGQYETAARVFAEGYQQYPQSAKVADNLLKLGLSLDAMGKSEDACVALSQLDKGEFKGAGPVMRRAEQEKKRLKC